MERKNDGFRKPSFSSDAGFQKTTVEIEVCFAFKGVALLRRLASEDAFVAAETEVSMRALAFFGRRQPVFEFKGHT